MNPPPLMLVTTANDFAGYEILEYLGIARGIVVRSTGIARGIVGGLRSIGGGNIPEYVVVCEEARLHAYESMVDHAAQIGANAIVASATTRQNSCKARPRCSHMAPPLKSKKPNDNL